MKNGISFDIGTTLKKNVLARFLIGINGSDNGFNAPDSLMRR